VQHERFIREGTTIHLKQAISMSMAALGGEMIVETVGGKRLLKIPAGTQQGTVITMKAEGVPQLNHPERRGDQLVHLFIETPTRLSEEEKDLYRKLSELRGERLAIPENERPVAPQTQQNSKEQGKGQQSFFDAIAGVFKGKSADGD
jgi:DnaJ-class molecular chaperone